MSYLDESFPIDFVEIVEGPPHHVGLVCAIVLTRSRTVILYNLQAENEYSMREMTIMELNEKYVLAKAEPYAYKVPRLRVLFRDMEVAARYFKVVNSSRTLNVTLDVFMIDARADLVQKQRRTCTKLQDVNTLFMGMSHMFAYAVQDNMAVYANGMQFWVKMAPDVNIRDAADLKSNMVSPPTAFSYAYWLVESVQFREFIHANPRVVLAGRIEELVMSPDTQLQVKTPKVRCNHTQRALTYYNRYKHRGTLIDQKMLSTHIAKIETQLERYPHPQLTRKRKEILKLLYELKTS